jgi:hypothetical protein
MRKEGIREKGGEQGEEQGDGYGVPRDRVGEVVAGKITSTGRDRNWVQKRNAIVPNANGRVENIAAGTSLRGSETAATKTTSPPHKIAISPSVEVKASFRMSLSQLRRTRPTTAVEVIHALSDSLPRTSAETASPCTRRARAASGGVSGAERWVNLQSEARTEQAFSVMKTT